MDKKSVNNSLHEEVFVEGWSYIKAKFFTKGRHGILHQGGFEGPVRVSHRDGGDVQRFQGQPDPLYKIRIFQDDTTYIPDTQYNRQRLKELTRKWYRKEEVIEFKEELNNMTGVYEKKAIPLKKEVEYPPVFMLLDDIDLDGESVVIEDAKDRKIRELQSQLEESKRVTSAVMQPVLKTKKKAVEPESGLP